MWTVTPVSTGSHDHTQVHRWKGATGPATERLCTGVTDVTLYTYSCHTRIARCAAVRRCVCVCCRCFLFLCCSVCGAITRAPPLGVPSRRRPDSPIIGRFFVAHFQRFFTDSGGRRAASHRHTQSLLSILCVCVCVSCVCDDGMMKASHHPLIPLSTPHCPPSAHHCGKHCLPQLAACPGSV